MPLPFILETFLPYQASVLAGRLSREYPQLYRDQFGLTRAEWRVIAHLSQETGVSVRESRAASRLEQAGLITKQTNSTDRRLVELALSPEGHAMMAKIAQLALAHQATLLDRLGPESGGFP